MTHVIYRHRVPPGSEAAFVAAWERCKRKVCKRAKGARGARLLRSATDPGTFVTVTRWDSLEDWRTYWTEGRVPDPEGDPGANEVFVEVLSIEES
jgi:heme-degrading monooxygenase HmoA